MKRPHSEEKQVLSPLRTIITVMKAPHHATVRPYCPYSSQSSPEDNPPEKIQVKPLMPSTRATSHRHDRLVERADPVGTHHISSLHSYKEKKKKRKSPPQPLPTHFCKRMPNTGTTQDSKIQETRPCPSTKKFHRVTNSQRYVCIPDNLTESQKAGLRRGVAWAKEVKPSA